MKSVGFFSGVTIALAFGACDCGGPICGDGTQLIDGVCTPIDDGGEGEGEGGEGEGEDVVCGPGTTLVDGSCAPLCDDAHVFNPDSANCECPPGLRDDRNGGCSLDPNTCAIGTVFDEATNACKPETAEPPADDERNNGNPVVIELPAVDDKPLEIGGILDLPTLGQADTDEFQFNGTAGTRLNISVVSFGAQAASFVLNGIEIVPNTNGLANYVRFGLPAAQRTAFRTVELPIDGDYTIIVSDVSTFAGGLPSGGADFDYNLVIDTLPPLDPADVGAGDSVNGDLANVDGWQVDNSVAVGDFIDAQLSEADPNVLQTLWFVNDGFYAEAIGGIALIPQIAGGTVLHPDFIFNINSAAATDYTLTIEGRPAVDGPEPNGPPIVVDTGGEQLTFLTLDVQENNVYRVRVELPTTTSVGLADDSCLFAIDGFCDEPFFCAENTDATDCGKNSAIVDTNLRVIAGCVAATFNPEGQGDQFECKFLARETGQVYFKIFDGEDESPIVFPNNNVRMGLEEAPVEPLISIGVGDPPVILTKNAPASAAPDFWFGTWFHVSAEDIQFLNMTTNQNVNMNLFPPDDMRFPVAGPVSATAPLPLYVIPGSTFLVQTVQGNETGTFVFAVTAGAPPYIVETEPNNDSNTADPISEGIEHVGIDGAADVDIWRIEAPTNGFLTVTAQTESTGLLPPGDVFVELLDSDGASVLDGQRIMAPTFGILPSTVAREVTAGTYFIRVSQMNIPQFGIVGAVGAYSLTWDLDPERRGPPTCALPQEVTSGEFVVGSVLGGETGPTLDNDCFGFPSDVYVNGDAVFSATIPANGTLQASIVNADFDTALAVIDSCAAATCLAGQDAFPGGETVVHQNPTNVEQQVLIVVKGFNDFFGFAEAPTDQFTLEVQIFGGTCRLGETRCNGNFLETCNSDGSGFNQADCPGGCLFDDFELRGECLPFCGPGTDNPDDFCPDQNTVAVCSADGTRYLETTCAGSCVGDANAGFCEFGLCGATPVLGGTTCVSEDRFGDATPETFLITCNDDATLSTRTACNVGEACDGDTCINTGALQQICESNFAACTDNVETVCNGSGTTEEQTFCAVGCDRGGAPTCGVTFGENCNSAGQFLFPAQGGSVVLNGNTGGAVDDIATTNNACPFGSDGAEDVVTSFVADDNGTVTVRQDGFDGVVAFYEAVCGGEPPFICEDDFDFGNPFFDEFTAPVEQGVEYFIVVAPFFAGDGGPFTLTVTNN